ncbi:protein-tyrosine phosphatase [Blastococcus sp. DSM 46786]|uniref:arsenate reductase/protein-tyrosine-phosphatase family protein n=1 Tax=Blastococcus sp. DSM 46786 TaxID=1798227 RepID=UPI0008AB5E0E|nr:hypothetical protein [Blastococcus sp. DSM 46786]SEL20321.1 protein-tyrosine phosphatase [Blastococcus sp. DSM 46786]
MTGGAGAGRDFRILILCAANVCRSPLAEGLLRAELGPGADVHVTSAGLRVRAGDRACTTMAAVAGVPVPDSTVRQVGPELLRRADLVLTMTRAQRAAAVNLAPACVRRTFTLREFAELAALAAGEPGPAEARSPGWRLDALAAAAPRFRARRAAGVHDDIDDAHGHGAMAYARTAGDVRRAVAGIAGLALDTPAVHRG